MLCYLMDIETYIVDEGNGGVVENYCVYNFVLAKIDGRKDM